LGLNAETQKSKNGPIPIFDFSVSQQNRNYRTLPSLSGLSLHQGRNEGFLADGEHIIGGFLDVGANSV